MFILHVFHRFKNKALCCVIIKHCLTNPSLTCSSTLFQVHNKASCQQTFLIFQDIKTAKINECKFIMYNIISGFGKDIFVFKTMESHLIESLPKSSPRCLVETSVKYLRSCPSCSLGVNANTDKDTNILITKQRLIQIIALCCIPTITRTFKRIDYPLDVTFPLLSFFILQTSNPH